jgi:hypothetical protein
MSAHICPVAEPVMLTFDQTKFKFTGSHPWNFHVLLRTKQGFRQLTDTAR